MKVRESVLHFYLDIYNPISKESYPSLIRVFLNLIKVQFKDSYKQQDIDINVLPDLIGFKLFKLSGVFIYNIKAKMQN